MAAQVISISRSLGVEAQIVGRVESFEKKQVTVKTSLGEFVYY
jgi:phosphoribosylformylglycinamidine cyclo-ligase